MAMPADPSQCERRLPSSRLADDVEFRSRLSSWSNKQHQDKSKAGIISWLQANYEVGCRESIAKEDVYRHYVVHCKQEGTEPLRASMFGKLVHRAFPGVKSSRIGTRGATRHSYKSFRLRSHAGGVPLAGVSALPSRSALTSQQQQQQQAGPFHYQHHHHQVQPFLTEEGWSSGSEANSSNPSSPVPSPLSSCLASSSDGVEEVVMVGHNYHYYPQQHQQQQHQAHPPFAYNCSQPPSQQHHYSHQHHQHQHHQHMYHPHPSAVCDSPTYSCGPSSSAAGSPSFPSPPGLPFDSFAYTSASFSSLLSPPLPPLPSASLASTLACSCDECAHFSGLAVAPPPRSAAQHHQQQQAAQSSSTTGGGSFPSSSSGPYEPVPLPSSFWTSQNSSMMRLPRGHMLPPVVGDLAFRHLPPL